MLAGRAKPGNAGSTTRQRQEPPAKASQHQVEIQGHGKAKPGSTGQRREEGQAQTRATTGSAGSPQARPGKARSAARYKRVLRRAVLVE